MFLIAQPDPTSDLDLDSARRVLSSNNVEGATLNQHVLTPHSSTPLPPQISYDSPPQCESGDDVVDMVNVNLDRLPLPPPSYHDSPEQTESDGDTVSMSVGNSPFTPPPSNKSLPPSTTTKSKKASTPPPKFPPFQSPQSHDSQKKKKSLGFSPSGISPLFKLKKSPPPNL